MRTEQDNDITLYTLEELYTMKRIYEAGGYNWHIFSLVDIKAEINKRLNKTI